MPQITVEYSAELTDAFDRRGFALALHAPAADLLEGPLDDFKTRFYVSEESVIGEDSGSNAMIHVELAILSGRTPETKQELGRIALETASRYLSPVPGLTVQVTVEVRDLDRVNYHKRVMV
ncbi:5-carboxymethyl-2-hydroxymuconate Delta-isomerase [Streptomyces sp. SP17BM10]|uniref:5-carboxymethyl-2-hydroxymuconate Delta-isomerase n=1 Tax=Streptomyces sp. SP17BM10 TaxID=3002530 RepID=UPI002E7786F2|nr:5-carboxymethyl-2-hydroxymuconate Delta-isomerase [Streptomyces sp. SP17BM10]MEE1782600.1 5-carboxymethyl-2-hydroxymuconate Delta-isomerase [Streptomyces sp. SP17BM10]